MAAFWTFPVTQWPAGSIAIEPATAPIDTRGIWRRTEASATKTMVIVAAIMTNSCEAPPDSSAHYPTDGLSTPPMRPNATAVPTPVARTAVG